MVPALHKTPSSSAFLSTMPTRLRGFPRAGPLEEGKRFVSRRGGMSNTGDPDEMISSLEKI